MTQISGNMFTAFDESSDADFTLTVGEDGTITFVATPPVSMEDLLKEKGRITGTLATLDEEKAIEEANKRARKKRPEEDVTKLTPPVLELEGAKLFFPEERPDELADAVRAHWRTNARTPAMA